MEENVFLDKIFWLYHLLSDIRGPLNRAKNLLPFYEKDKPELSLSDGEDQIKNVQESSWHTIDHYTLLNIWTFFFFHLTNTETLYCFTYIISLHLHNPITSIIHPSFR